MEYIEGRSPGDHLSLHSGSIAGVVDLMKRITQAVVPIHQKNLIHRDLKPANLIIDAADGRVKILDLDSITRPDRKYRLTQADRFLGTPAYSSPEQQFGTRSYGALSPASDVFSLGVIFYELIAGALPFREQRDIQWGTPMPLTNGIQAHWGISRAVADRLNDIILRCLHRKPSNRYRDSAAVIEELERLAVPGGEYSAPLRLKQYCLRQYDRWWLASRKYDPSKVTLATSVLLVACLFYLIQPSATTEPSQAEYIQYVEDGEQYRATSADNSEMSWQSASALNNRLERARPRLAGAPTGSANWQSFRLGNALKAIAEHRPEEALDELNGCRFEGHPDTTVRFLGCRANGIAYMTLPRPDWLQARRWFHKARECAPNHPNVWLAALTEGHCLLTLKKWKQATEVLDSALKQYFDSAKRLGRLPVHFGEARIRSALVQCHYMIGTSQSLDIAFAHCDNAVFQKSAVPENGMEMKLLYVAILLTKADLGKRLGKLNDGQYDGLLRLVKNEAEASISLYPKAKSLFLPALAEAQALLTLPGVGTSLVGIAGLSQPAGFLFAACVFVSAPPGLTAE
jgi:tetratricopeptide (TPR) repeat protein